MRPHQPERRAVVVPRGLAPLLRELVSLAIGLGLLAPLAHGLIQRLPAAAAGAPALIARLQAAERRGGPREAEEEEAVGPVLHLLPEVEHDRAACALALAGRGRPAVVRVVVPCQDGPHHHATRGRSARP